MDVANTGFDGGAAPFILTSGSISGGHLVTSGGIAGVSFSAIQAVAEPSTAHALSIQGVSFSAYFGGGLANIQLTYLTANGTSIPYSVPLNTGFNTYSPPPPSDPIATISLTLTGQNISVDWLNVDYKVVLTRPNHTSLNDGITNSNGSDDAQCGGDNPISLRYGEKRESILDMDMNTPNGSLNLTRTYRQYYQDTLRFMGMGWSHNHHSKVRSHTGGKIWITMPDGGDIVLQETAPQGLHYRGLPGLSAELMWHYGSTNPELLFELTFADGNEYWFGTNLMLYRHIHPNGGMWRYEYETNANASDYGLLKRVYDADQTGTPLGKELKFRYYGGMVSPNGFKNGHLWRVGDHTSDNLLSTNPTGRYVQYDYTRSWSGAGHGILTSVRDVRGNVWTYEYAPNRAWRGTQLVPIKVYKSPAVISPTTNFISSPMVLKHLAYTWRNGNADEGIDEITQLLGKEALAEGVPSAPPDNQQDVYRTVEKYDFILNGYTPITKVSVGGKITTHKFDYGAYTGADDPEGNSENQQLNGYYQVSQLTNGNSDVTALEWTSDGAFLKKATNAEGKITRFKYENEGQLNARLIEIEDATGTITKYFYEDGSAPRLPSRVRVIRQPDANTTVYYKETHYAYNELGAKIREIEFDVAFAPVPWKAAIADYDATQFVRRVQYTYETDTASASYKLLKSTTTHDVKNSANNQTATYTYDAWGRVIKAQQTSVLGSCQFTHTFYDDAGNVTATVCGTSDLPANSTVQSIQTIYETANPDKYRVTIYEYDTMGRRIIEKTNVGSPDAQVKYYYHDALSRLSRVVTNVQPTTTTWATVGVWWWSVLDKVWKTSNVTNAPTVDHGPRQDQNLVEYYEYNELNKMRLKRDALGRTTLYSYGAAGRLQRVIENASNPNYFSQNHEGPGISYRIIMGTGDYVESADPDLDIETEYNYDNASNVKRVKRFRVPGSGNDNAEPTAIPPVFEIVSEYSLDRLGRINEEVINPVEPHANPDNPAYLASLAKPDQNIVSNKYFDEIGRVARTRRMVDFYDWESSDSNRKRYRATLYGFDPLSRTIKTVESASVPNYVTTINPDIHSISNYPGNGVALSPDSDLDIITEVKYDAAGRKMYEVDALGQRTWYAYDGLGRVVRTVKNAIGTATDMSANDPRSTTYVISSTPDQDLVTNTFYNTDGYVQRVQEIKDAANQNWYWTLFQYDAKGRVTREIRNAANTAYHGGSWSDLSGYGALSTDTDKDLATTTVYDSLGRVQTVTDEKTGNTTYTGYDRMGRTVIAIKNYVAQGSTNPLNWVWMNNRWENGAGAPISHGTANDQNLISTTTYDRLGRVIATRDSAGSETRLTLDQAGRVTKIVEQYVDGVYSSAAPDQDRTTLNTYSKAGYLLTTTDPRGTVTKHEYDKVGRRIKTTTAFGTALATTTYTCYNKVGDVLRVIQNYIPSGSLAPDKRSAPTVWEFNPSTHGTNNDQNLITEYRYDKMGRTAWVINPVGNAASTGYNKAGVVTSTTDPLNNVTWFVHDRLRRVTLVVQNYLPQTLAPDPQGRSNTPDSWTWEASGNRWRDGRGDTVGHGTDGAKNLIVAIAYNKAGQMVSRREPRGHLTQYTYDRLDRRRTLVNPLNITWETQYTLDTGKPRVSQIYPGLNGSTTPYTVARDFDRAGRLASIAYSDSANTPNVALAYTLAGRRASMTETGASPVRKTEYAYDAAHRPTQIRYDVNGDGSYDHTIQYAYDAAGLRTQVKAVSDGNRTIDYGYDALGRNTAIVNTYAGVAVGTTATYDAANRLKEITRNLVKSTYTYDAASRVTQLHHWCAYPGNPLTLMKFDYIVNALGNRTQAVEQWRPNSTQPVVQRTINYAYDSASRLIGATYYPNLTGTGSPIHTYGYTYDRSGNRLTETLNGTTRTFTYNAANQLVTQNGVTLTYDRNGNLLNDGTNTHVWDRANRLKSMGGVSYNYDGDGDRTWRVAGGQATLYMLDKQAPLTTVLNEQNASNFTRYVHGLTGLLAQQNPAGVFHWMLQDGLQSLRGMSDGNDMLSAQAYSPYGEPMFTDMPTEFGFTGEQTDPLNDLVYLRARYLNPKLGIFGSLDPLEGQNQVVGSLNRYNWVRGNVVNLRDTSGMSPTTCQGISQTSSPLSPTPPNTEPIDVFFGGTYGCEGGCTTDIEGPLPQVQTPIWYQNSDISIQWPGVPKSDDPKSYIYPLDSQILRLAVDKFPHLDFMKQPRYQVNGEILVGKRLQAYLSEQQIMQQDNWENRDITLTGYSAGGDTFVPFLDESVDRLRDAGWEGNVTHVVVLGGTLSGGLRGGRSVENEFQNITSQAQLNGTHFFIWDDAAEEKTSWSSYQPPTGSIGNYTYHNSPMLHWVQSDTTGTNNSPTLWQDSQTWRMTHPYTNRNIR